MTNVAIIGCGSAGEIVAKNLLKLGERVKFGGFCDLNLDRAVKMSEKFGGDAYSDYKIMLDLLKIDAVFICTPPYCCINIAEECAEHGIHFMLEVPFSLGEDESLARLCSVAEEKNLVSMCRMESQFSRLTEVIRQFVDKNAVIYAEMTIITPPPAMFWKRDEELSGGILLEKGEEALLLLRSLLGDVKSSCTKFSRGYVTGITDSSYSTDDAMISLLKFENGSTAVLNLGNYGSDELQNCKNPTLILHSFGKSAEYTLHNYSKNTHGEVRVYGEKFDKSKTKKLQHAGIILPDEITNDCLIYADDENSTAENAFISMIESGNCAESAADLKNCIKNHHAALRIKSGDKA